MRNVLSMVIIVSMVLYLFTGCSQRPEGSTVSSNASGNDITTTEICTNIPNTCNENYSSVVNTKNTKYSYEDMLDDINQLVKKFPGKVRKEIVGYSELGREIPALILGSDDAPNRYLGLGASHAREYISSQLLVKIAEFYLRNYNNTINGEKLSDLFKRCQFHFVPMHNPDGVMLSQQGLDSLKIIKDPVERQKRIDFLVPLMQEMNAAENANAKDSGNRDSGWAPPSNGKYDFTYWKNNINGVDVHNNMYDSLMMDWLRAWYEKPENASYIEKPRYWNYLGESPLSQKESRALSDYCKKYNFNIAITHHAAGSVYQWNYGWKKELPYETAGSVREEKHKIISDRLAAFMDHTSSQSYNSYIGFTGWYLHMFPRAYSAVIELGTNTYFQSMPGYKKDRDACPLDVEQLTKDLSNGSIQRYSIWTKQKFTPAYTAQYIINSNKISPSISAPAAPRYLTAAPDGTKAYIYFAVSSDTGGSPITGYKLYQSTDNVVFTNFSSITASDDNKFTVSGLLPDTKYYFKVSALNKTGEGEKSQETLKVDTTVKQGR